MSGWELDGYGWPDGSPRKRRRRRKPENSQRYKRWQEQAERCCWCGNRTRYDDSTWEHLIPKHRGFGGHLRAVSCVSCNHRRKEKFDPPDDLVADFARPLYRRAVAIAIYVYSFNVRHAKTPQDASRNKRYIVELEILNARLKLV